MRAAARLRPFAAALAITLLVPSAVRAEGDFSTTFRPDAVTSWMRPGAWAVLVVEAGRLDATTHAAAEALRSALRSSGRATVVMDDEALGDITHLRDMDILDDAAPLAPDFSFILRHPVANDSLVKLNVYDRNAYVVAHASVRPGVTVEPVLPGPRNPKSEGDSPRPARRARPQSAPASFEELTLEHEGGRWSGHVPDAVAPHLIRLLTPDAQGSVDNLRAMIGSRNHPLRGGDLYEALGHPRMAERVRSMERLQNALVGVGIAISAGGVMLAIGGNALNHGDGLGLPLAGIGLGISGIVMALSSLGVPVHPMNARQMRRLVEEHNREVMEEYNAKPADEKARAPRPPEDAPRLDLAPMLSPTGGGLAIVGSF